MEETGKIYIINKSTKWINNYCTLICFVIKYKYQIHIKKGVF